MVHGTHVATPVYGTGVGVLPLAVATPTAVHDQQYGEDDDEDYQQEANNDTCTHITLCTTE